MTLEGRRSQTGQVIEYDAEGGDGQLIPLHVYQQLIMGGESLVHPLTQFMCFTVFTLQEKLASLFYDSGLSPLYDISRVKLQGSKTCQTLPALCCIWSGRSGSARGSRWVRKGEEG